VTCGRVGARAVELALELRQHQGDGLGGAGGGGHDVERRGARAAQVPVARVQQPPVLGRSQNKQYSLKSSTL